MKELKVLTSTGMLGYGFPATWFKEGLKANPDVITVDSGSTDSGPHKLGMGALTCSVESYYKDTSMLLGAGHACKIPVFISSAGGAGADKHLEIFNEIVKKICREKKMHLKIAVIHGEISKGKVKEKLKQKKQSPVAP